MTETSQWWRSVFICLCLAVVTAAVYWPVRHFEFTNYDDDVYVTENPHVQGGVTLRGVVWAFTTPHFNMWMPLTWLSCMLDCQLFGLNAGAHHLVNVLFHIANTLLLFTVLNRMTAAQWRSAFVAALFALHPLHVESVAWVAERKDVLSTFFWMLTMLAYVHYVEQPNGGRYLLALGLCALGLMAKPMLVTLPFVLLLLDYWPLGRTRWAQSAIGVRKERSLGYLLREKLPFIALMIPASIVTYWAEQRGGLIVLLDSLPVGMRVVNAVVSYVRYLGKAFWPVGLAAFYPYRTWSLVVMCGAGAVLAGVSGAVIWRARRQPYLFTGWLWYLGTLVPVIGLVQAGTQSMADRYTYIPLVGLFIMVAWCLPHSLVEQRKPRMVAVATAAALLVSCAVLTGFQVRHWKNNETLFRHVLNVTKDNHLAHENLGRALLDQGKFAEATAEFAALLRIKPDSAPAHNNLANALAAQGKAAEAIAEYQAALRIKPDFAEAHNNLAGTIAGQGKLAEATAEYQAALRIKPDLAEAHNNLANTLIRQGRLAEAVAECQAALRIKPDLAEAHYNLGNALASEGKVAEAIAEYRASLRIKPDNVGAHNNLGAALASQDKVAEAMGEYAAALRIKPDYADAHYNLGVALANQGRIAEATTEYRETLRLRPDWPPALGGLAWILATSSNESVRNGGEAVQLAERLCAVSGCQEADGLDVLAAAYAEAGRFDDAVRVAQRAVEAATAAGPGDLAGQIQERLKLYRASRPYRAGPEQSP
jgi:tetratricopeptide (TPR) repeat protein